MEKEQEICPVCGCHIGAGAYEKEGVLYCCRACATSGQCECGCCEEAESATPEE